ncbi:hypothetical protein GQ457_11G008270 [Hibiscus cannabinus]
MSRDQPSSTATASDPGATAIISRPDADPPDPGRRPGPMALGQSTDMDVSSPENPTQTLVLPATDMHQASPMSSSRVSNLDTNPSPASYKDTLIAYDTSKSATGNVFTDNEEVKLVEGDVTRSTVDGLISIVFSERVQALAVKNFDLTVVVKLLGRRIGYNTLRTRLLDLWKPFEAFRLMDIENDYFLVTFKSNSDFSNAVSGGPWVLFGHYLVVEPWTVDFSTSQSHPNRVLAWIRLPGLPVTLYQCGMITAIGECIGPVIKIDYQTESGCRGRFARMAISLDLRNVSAPSIEPTTTTPHATNEAFGPWMKVERRQRRVVCKDVNGKQSNPGFVIAQSRFNPIFEDETPVEQDILVDRHSSISAANHSNLIAQVSPKAAVEDPQGKGKALVNSHPAKSRSSLPVRKSVTVQRSYAASTSKSGPLPSRQNSSLSGTHFAPFPRPVPRINKSNHSAVVISETDAPVILQGGSFPPLVPDTLLGAIKPPNLEDRQQQPPPLPPIADGQLQPSSLPALADRQLQPSSLPSIADAQSASITFADLVLREREWNVPRLSDYLLPEAIPFVVGIPPPLPENCDMPSWISTPAGNFTVASAYMRILEPGWEAVDSKWSWVWSLAVTPRIRMFIWLVLKQRLMTNEERCRRGFSFDASCPSCGCVSESITHILRDCPPTRSLWQSIVPRDRQALFFAAPLETWVVSNIRADYAFGVSLILWPCFYPSLLWQLWKCRNDFSFTGTCLPLDEVYKIGFAWATRFAEAIIVDRPRAAHMHTYLQWEPPTSGWVCLNVDASISPLTGIGSVGGVLRDAAGAWICGYQKCVGKVSILQAELWSVLVGLQVVRSFDYTRVQVQSDNSHAIKLLLDSSTIDKSMPLVCAIGLLRQEPWQIDFRWIPREMNMVADCLSKLPTPPQFRLSVISNIPEAVAPLLDRDRDGPPYSRRGRGVL